MERISSFEDDGLISMGASKLIVVRYEAPKMRVDIRKVHSGCVPGGGLSISRLNQIIKSACESES